MLGIYHVYVCLVFGVFSLTLTDLGVLGCAQLTAPGSFTQQDFESRCLQLKTTQSYHVITVTCRQLCGTHGTITLYDGASTADPVLGEYHECSNNRKLKTTQKNMVIVLSEGNNMDIQCSVTSELGCITGTSGTRVKSRDHPQHYNNNEEQCWSLTSSPKPTGELTCTEFKTEKDQDLMTIYNRQGGSVVAGFSGQYNPSAITVTGSSLYITFTSDAATTDIGFNCIYVGKDDDSGSPQQSSISSTSTTPKLDVDATTTGVSDGDFFSTLKADAKDYKFWVTVVIPAVAAIIGVVISVCVCSYRIMCCRRCCARCCCRCLGCDILAKNEEGNLENAQVVGDAGEDLADVASQCCSVCP